MASNNFHRLFDCPVWAHDHAGIETDKLKEYILSVQKNDPNGRKVSNVEGWQSNFQHLQTPELQQFFQQVIVDLNYYYEQLGGDMQKYEVSITDCWFNINGKNTYNRPHAHTGYLSLVYYVEATEDSGHIMFHHPAEHLQIHWRADWFKENRISANAGNWIMPPKTNRCYIFPGWLVHSVNMNTTNNTRISIALNTSISLKS